MTYLVAPLGVELHTLTEDQVFGLIRAFPDMQERTVGLGFPDGVQEQPAGLILHFAGDKLREVALVDEVRAVVSATGLEPGEIEFLTDDEYETRLFAQADAGGES